MRAWRQFVYAIAIAFAPMAAPAQTSSDMVAAFKAYRTAYEAGDLEAAERHAIAALAAAQAMGSDKHAILAINLAGIQNELGRFAEAKAAAERAAADIAAGADGDLRLAQLLAGRAGLELGEKKAAPAVEKLLGQIGSPDDSLTEATYQAGLALAKHGIREGDYDRAKIGYRAAVSATQLEAGAAAVDRIQALTGLGAAELASEEFGPSAEHLNEAVALAAPLAPETTGPEPSMGERLYARALAWRAALSARVPEPRARTGSRIVKGEELEERPNTARPLLPGRPPICSLKLVSKPKISYPREALNRLSVGAVVMRLGVSEDGKVTAARLVAAVPVEQGFEAAVLEATQSWVFERSDPEGVGPQACRLQTDSYLQVVKFVVD